MLTATTHTSPGLEAAVGRRPAAALIGVSADAIDRLTGAGYLRLTHTDVYALGSRSTLGTLTRDGRDVPIVSLATHAEVGADGRRKIGFDAAYTLTELYLASSRYWSPRSGARRILAARTLAVACGGVIVGILLDVEEDHRAATDGRIAYSAGYIAAKPRIDAAPAHAAITDGVVGAPQVIAVDPDPAAKHPEWQSACDVLGLRVPRLVGGVITTISRSR